MVLYSFAIMLNQIVNQGYRGATNTERTLAKYLGVTFLFLFFFKSITENNVNLAVASKCFPRKHNSKSPMEVIGKITSSTCQSRKPNVCFLVERLDKYVQLSPLSQSKGRWSNYNKEWQCKDIFQEQSTNLKQLGDNIWGPEIIILPPHILECC